MSIKSKGGQTRIYGEDRVVVSVSVPQKVKDRMDKFKKRRKVNWSQVAVAAFKDYMKARKG